MIERLDANDFSLRYSVLTFPKLTQKSIVASV